MRTQNMGSRFITATENNGVVSTTTIGGFKLIQIPLYILIIIAEHRNPRRTQYDDELILLDLGQFDCLIER